MKYLLTVLMVVSSQHLPAQLQEIRVSVLFQGEEIRLGQHYALGQEDSIQFSRIRFYISDLTFFFEGKEVRKVPERYILVDLSEQSSLHITSGMSSNMKVDELRFKLGIDSLTNVSGAMGGALDPTKGMYWTWQSGYVNVKIEGSSSLCQSRKNEFIYHLGGYRTPYASMQHVSLPCHPHESTLTLDLTNWIESMDLTAFHYLMSPGEKAARSSALLAKQFNMTH